MILLKRILRNSIYNVLGYIWPIILFLISVPYMIHKLGIEEYGIWVLMSSLVSSLGILNLGVGNANIKYISEYYTSGDIKMVNRIIRNSFLIYIVAGILILFIGVLASPYLVQFFHIKESHREVTIFVFRILTIVLVTNNFMLNVASIFKAIQRYDISNKLKIIVDTMKIMGIICVLYLGYGLKEMAGIYLIVSFLGLVSIFVLMRKILPGIHFLPKYEKVTMKMIFSFSFYSFVMGTSNVLRLNIGQIVISRLLGVSYVPFFSIPLQISSTLLNTTAAVASPLFPVFSSLKRAKENEKITNVFINSVKYTTLIGITIFTCIFIFSHPILSFWINAGFANKSSTILKILTLSHMFTILNVIAYFYLMGFGRVKIISIFEISTAILILLLSLVLTPFFGLTGVATAYFIGNVILVSYVYFVAKDIWLNDWLKESMRLFFPFTIPAVIMIIGSFVIINPKIDNIYSLSIWVLVYFLVYCLIAIFVDLRFYKERSIFEKILVRVRRRNQYI
jgi:O-antigen/teichoic acid export membrane protein